MPDFTCMSYQALREYASFRERQILKSEATLEESEFRSIEERLDELRKEGGITPLKHAVLVSQIRSMRQWNNKGA